MKALRLPVYFPVLGVPTPPNYTGHLGAGSLRNGHLAKALATHSAGSPPFLIFRAHARNLSVSTAGTVSTQRPRRARGAHRWRSSHPGRRESPYPVAPKSHEKSAACLTPDCAPGRTHSIFYLSRCSCVTYDFVCPKNLRTLHFPPIVSIVVVAVWILRDCFVGQGTPALPDCPVEAVARSVSLLATTEGIASPPAGPLRVALDSKNASRSCTTG